MCVTIVWGCMAGSGWLQVPPTNTFMIFPVDCQADRSIHLLDAGICSSPAVRVEKSNR